MPLIQALLVSVITILSSIYPVSVTAHYWALSYFTGWEAPPPVFMGMLSLAGFLGLFFYFIHDWASIISSFIRVILFWKSPKTLDERMLFFIAVTSIPLILAWIYGQPFIESIEVTPLWIAGCLVLFCIPAWLGERLNRNQKNMLNWSFFDALWVGVMQIQVLLPGAGRQIGSLAAAYLRNYNRESSLKFSFLTLTPLLLVFAVFNLQEFSFSNSEPAPNLSWLTLGVCFVVSIFCAILAVGSVMKNAEKKGLGGTYLYRVLLAVAIVITYWIRSNSEA